MKKIGTGSNMLIYVLCVALGGIIRIAYCWKYPVPVRDSFVYESFIKQWIATGMIPEIREYPPLSMFLVKIPSELFGYQIQKMGIIVNVVLGLGIIIILMRIAEMVCSSKMALLFAGLFTATHYAFVQYSCHLTRENSYLFFCCLSILFFLKYYKSKNDMAITICAVFISLSCLCRHEAIEMLLLFGGALLLMKHRKITKKLTSIFLLVSVTVISFGLTVKMLGLSKNFYKQYYMKVMNEGKSEVYDSFFLNNIPL